MRRIVLADGPDPIDLHVGARLRDRRIMLGMSQSALAEKLGVSFQQVQKYERGTNRLSASQLWRAAEALQVKLSFFFSGLASGASGASPAGISRRQAEMLRAFDAMPKGTQGAFFDLAVAVTRGDDPTIEDRD